MQSALTLMSSVCGGFSWCMCDAQCWFLFFFSSSYGATRFQSPRPCDLAQAHVVDLSGRFWRRGGMLKTRSVFRQWSRSRHESRCFSRTKTQIVLQCFLSFSMSLDNLDQIGPGCSVVKHITRFVQVCFYRRAWVRLLTHVAQDVSKQCGQGEGGVR